MCAGDGTVYAVVELSVNGDSILIGSSAGADATNSNRLIIHVRHAGVVNVACAIGKA